MKAATAKEIRQELNERTPKELLDFCLRLSRFKKENKELLTYLLFDSADEEGYRQSVIVDMDEKFSLLNRSRLYLMTKGVRRILRDLRKYIRYSGNKETEVELLLHYCTKLKAVKPNRHSAIQGLYDRTILGAEKKIEKLHPDLQYDHYQRVKELKAR